MQFSNLARVQHSNIPGARDNISRGYVVPERHQAHVALDDLLGRMDVTQLYKMADFFESQSMAIRAHALWLTHKRDDEAATDTKMHYLNVEGPRAVRRFLRRGHTLDAALAEASAITGIRRDTVEWHYKQWAKAPESKQQRSNLMFDMAQHGHTDTAIGAALYLHEKSVNRLLRELKAKRGLRRPKKIAAPVAQERPSQEHNDW